MTRITPRRIRALGALAAAAPFLTLTGVRSLDPFSGPATAGAASATESTEIETTPVRRAPRPTEAERAAHVAAQALAGEPIPPTPFYYAPGTLLDASAMETPTVVAATGAPTPSFQVSAILSGGGAPIAVINGAALRVGQKVVEGWTLAEVHEARREVVLAHAEGQRIVVPIRR